MTTVSGDIIRTVAGFNYGGVEPMSNTLHFKDTGGGGILDADLLTEMGLMLELSYNSLHNAMGQTMDFTEYSVQNITQGTIIGTLPWPTFTAGLAAGALVAPQVVALLRMPTAKSKVQGRVNVVGMREADVTQGIILATFLAATLALGAELLLPFAVIGGQLTYVVFNQEFATSNIPVSAALGDATRVLGRRRLN